MECEIVNNNITKVMIYEYCLDLLEKSNFIKKDDIPHKDESRASDRSYIKDYIEKMAYIVKLNYNNIKKIDISNFDINYNINHTDIMQYLEKEINRDVYNILFDFKKSRFSTEYFTEYITLAERINELLDNDKYKLRRDIERDPELYSHSFQRIGACLRNLTDMNYIECKEVDDKHYYKKKCCLNDTINILKDNLEDIIIDIDKMECKIDSQNYFKDEILNNEYIKKDKNKLLEYIQTIIDLELDIHSLKKRYRILQQKYIDNIKKNSKEYAQVDKILEKEKNDIRVNIRKYELKINDRPILDNSIKVKKPSKPKKPTFSLLEPMLPVYLVPNIFNKKKVLLENERLKEEYKEKLKVYNEEQEKYQDKLKQYEISLKEYKDELCRCEQEENDLNQKQYEKELEKFEQEKEKYMELLEKEKEQFENYCSNYVEMKEKKLAGIDKYNELRAISYEKEYIVSLIEKNIKLRNRLYSKGVIYSKYRSFIILSKFYEYFLSGRCLELEGPFGAYNLYEQESRADIIIDKLDNIENSLEQIKDNQSHIYNELKRVNHSLELINSQLFVNNYLKVVQLDKLDKIIDNTENIAYNTKVCAYYSQKSANYQKGILLLKLFNG